MSASGKKDQVRNQNANLRDEIKTILESDHDFDICVKRAQIKIQLAIFDRLGDVLIRMEDS